MRRWRELIGNPLFFYSSSHFGPVFNNPSPSARSSLSRTESPVIPKPSNPTSSISLSTILNNNSNGLALADSYNKNQKFSDKQRVQLINVVALYFNMNKIHLDLATSYKLEKEIVDKFPTEKKVNSLYDV